MLEGVSGSEFFVPHLWIMGRTYPAVPVCKSGFFLPQTFLIFGSLATEGQIFTPTRFFFYTNWVCFFFTPTVFFFFF